VRRGIDRGKPEEAGGTAEVPPPTPGTAANSLKLQASTEHCRPAATCSPRPRLSPSFRSTNLPLSPPLQTSCILHLASCTFLATSLSSQEPCKNFPHVLRQLITRSRSCSKASERRLQSLFQRPLHHAVDTSSEARNLFTPLTQFSPLGLNTMGLIRDGDESHSRPLSLSFFSVDLFSSLLG
jgi:hypothetical protein